MCFVDIIFSSILLIIFLPVMLVVSFLCFLLNGSPIFFIDERLGLKGKSFKMIKFRTMINGKSISAKDDENRITPLGRILRKSSIDELPTIANVFLGKMSLVGPRPMPLKYLNRFDDIQKKRMDMKPGITGLAQINGRNKISWEKRFELDVSYVNNYSMTIDFIILFKTFFVLLFNSDVESKESEIMPEFLGNRNDKKY